MRPARWRTELCCVALLLSAWPATARTDEPATVGERGGIRQPEQATAGNAELRRTTTVRPADELRAAYLALVRQTSKSAARQDTFQPLERTAEALRLYIEISQTRHFSHAARSRMRSRLKQRLLQLHDRLVRLQKRLKRETGPGDLQPVAGRRDIGQPGIGRPVGTSSSTASTAGTPQARSGETLSGGGAEAARAGELIELIKETIAPDTWDIRGGRGTIRYFSLLRVLVVRQTGEAHHQLGSTLEVLRQQ